MIKYNYIEEEVKEDDYKISWIKADGRYYLSI